MLEENKEIKNELLVNEVIVEKRDITVTYTVKGEWEKYFRTNVFRVSYSCDLDGLPKSVAVVPFLANVLPVSWVLDGTVTVEECDKDFYESIPDFKKGYIDMYPAIPFKGKLDVACLEDNSSEDKQGAVAFFSGGVDAFNTLIKHYEEKPTLFTLQGADVDLNDQEGWDKVINHIESTVKEFDLNYETVKSDLQGFINMYKLSLYVRTMCKAEWWHDFQHGIGLISHAAPLMYVKKKKVVYFASSFTAADKGKITCASDPTIDNYVKFCGSDVIHDGYEFNRQQKIGNIVAFSNARNIRIPLRVCWISKGGSNCCNCEKCWRTTLGIYAEKADPAKYGFDIESIEEFGKKFYKNREVIATFSNARYGPILKRVKENYDASSINKELEWFYHINFKTIVLRKYYLKVANKIKKMTGVRK